MMQEKKIGVLILLFVLLPIFLLADGLPNGPFYVDDAGSDSNIGSKANPFQTIQRAVDVMATNVTSATCYVFPGTYSEQVTIKSNKNTGYMVITALSNDNQPILYNSGFIFYAFHITNASKVMISRLKIKKYSSSGIYLDGIAESNNIIRNSIWSNSQYGIYINSEDADNNYIFANDTWGANQDNGIRIVDGDNNTIISNIVHNNQLDGIAINLAAVSNNIVENSIYSNWNGISINYGDKNIVILNEIKNNQKDGIYLGSPAEENKIVKNIISSNARYGIQINSDTADNNYILTNEIYGGNQDYGIRVNNGDNSHIYRNLIKNFKTNICLSGSATNTKIYNNTIFGGSSDGVLVAGTSSALLYNNILLSNAGYGIRRTSSQSVYAGFNDFYGNGSGITNGGITWENGNITEYPILDATTFEITSMYSAVVDSGTNIWGTGYQGVGWDMGWKESGFTYTPYHGPYYVDDSGSDSYYGDKKFPFKTIQKAVDVMMSGVTSTTCYIFPGIYAEQVVIESNKNAGYMVITALSNNNPPVLDGSLSSNYGFYITNTSKVMISGLNITKYTQSGIYLTGVSMSNQIIRNSVYSNEYYGIYINFEDADNNYIFANDTWGANQDNGIRVRYGDNNIILSNKARNNQTDGIAIGAGAMSNYIEHNSLYSNIKNGISINNGDKNFIRYNEMYNNLLDGIYLGGTAEENIIVKNSISSNSRYGIQINPKNNYILTNEIYGDNQNYGILVKNGVNNQLYRNLIKNFKTNICLSGSATNTKIYNNTIFGGSGDGVRVANTSSAVLYNNILLSNAGYGISRTSTGIVYAGFNDFYGNGSGITNGGIIYGNGNITDDPMLDTTTFEITSMYSAVVDSGTNIWGAGYQGVNWDMGWKEYVYPDSTAPVTTVDKPQGVYYTAIDVKLTAVDNELSNNIMIYWTTDGSDPKSSSTVQSGYSPVTINLNKTTTLKFYAKNLANLEEDVKTQEYRIGILPDDVQVYNNYFNISSDEKLKVVFGKELTVAINIYNVQGLLVKSYASQSYKAGDYVEWDGTEEESNQKAGAGIYIVVIKGDINKKYKVILTK